jgi:hypothetical protein
MQRARHSLAVEAARIICEELVTDYRVAKQKAAQRLGVSGRGALPDNAEVQQAVIEHQRLFGGAEYAQRLAQMRDVAVRALRLLAPFSPRLVGGVISGAVTAAHRVQVHAFNDKPETLDIFLADRGIEFEAGDRNYRFGDGREERIPLASFEFDGVGVDVATFGESDTRRVPLNPADGAPFKRLGLEQAEALRKS